MDNNNLKLVLVVEDVLESQQLVMYLLKGHYETCFAISVINAKEILRKNPVDLILLDLSLAGDEDGLDLVRFLRTEEKWKDLPVVAVTAHAFNADKINCIEAGCDDYLAKPIKRTDLLDIIKRYI